MGTRHSCHEKCSLPLYSVRKEREKEFQKAKLNTFTSYHSEGIDSVWLALLVSSLIGLGSIPTFMAAANRFIPAPPKEDAAVKSNSSSDTDLGKNVRKQLSKNNMSAKSFDSNLRGEEGTRKLKKHSKDSLSLKVALSDNPLPAVPLFVETGLSPANGVEMTFDYDFAGKLRK